jgi:hypothetical protein
LESVAELLNQLNRASARKAHSEPELSGAQIASHFSVDEATVRRWKKAGMPAKQYNARLFRYRLSEVEAWLQARTTK